MTRDHVINRYFDWMYDLVCDRRYIGRLSYRKLFTFLYDKSFQFTIDLDGNRADDGIDLRYRFGVNCGYSQNVIATYLDDKECSVLEMLVALAIRCEENIMDDPNSGNRTCQWFWSMIRNLGLGFMTDAKFNKREADDIVERFLNHEYERNGEGGLFTVKHTIHDMRTTEIWNQAMWYLDEVIGG